MRSATETEPSKGNSHDGTGSPPRRRHNENKIRSKTASRLGPEWTSLSGLPLLSPVIGILLGFLGGFLLYH